LLWLLLLVLGLVEIVVNEINNFLLLEFLGIEDSSFAS
jgi:hypothetical protein